MPAVAINIHKAAQIEKLGPRSADNNTRLEQRTFVMVKIIFSDGSVVGSRVSDILSSAWPQN
jgi:hypothetical protein